MFSFFRKKLVSEIEQQPPLELPLSNIQKIDQAGILYIDKNGSPVSPLFTWQDERANQNLHQNFSYLSRDLRN